jgi:molecular chaperone GrpE (heat shock protein)
VTRRSEQQENHWSDLRRRAEEILDRQDAPETPPSQDELKKLLQEMRVAQIELEIQNEDLLQIQARLEQSRRRFQVLFHQAPSDMWSSTSGTASSRPTTPSAAWSTGR